MTDDREPAHLLGVAGGVGDDPVAGDQLRGHVAGVADRDRVGEGMLAARRVGLLGERADHDGVRELGLGHGGGF